MNPEDVGLRWWKRRFAGLGGSTPLYSRGKKDPTPVTPPIWQLFRTRQTMARKGLTRPESLPKTTEKGDQKGPKAMQREALGETWLRNLDFKDYI